jgi:hypothetical protein
VRVKPFVGSRVRGGPVSDGSLWEKHFENRGSCPLKTACRGLFSECRRSRFSFSKSNPVTYQTGSKERASLLRGRNLLLEDPLAAGSPKLPAL